MSKIDKERILRNLTSWSLTDENEFTATSWQFCGGPGSFISLEENEATEVKKAILEMVRKNAQSWRIEEINNFHNPKFFLIHQSVKKLETGFGNEIISNFGKIHNKKGFAEEEWEEVEKIISEGKNNIANPTNNNWTWKEYGLLGAGIAFIIFLLYLIVKKWFL